MAAAQLKQRASDLKGQFKPDGASVEPLEMIQVLELIEGICEELAAIQGGSVSSGRDHR
jgi:hypothetical protein